MSDEQLSPREGSDYGEEIKLKEEEVLNSASDISELQKKFDYEEE